MVYNQIICIKLLEAIIVCHVNFSVAMMLYKNIIAMVCPPDSDNDFTDIITRVLQGDTLIPFLFIT